MSILDIRQRTGYLFIAVTVGHIILISAQVNTRRGIPVLEEVTFGLFAEVQRSVYQAVEGVHNVWRDYIALQDVRNENQRLTEELAQLRIRLQEERAVADQARTLQGLLDLRTRTPLRTTGAMVIAGGASPDFRTITIDKGMSAGLRADMAVISPTGVIGRVIMPSALASKVQLLIDRNAAAGVLIERSRAQGIVVGTGTDRLRMDYVPSVADVQVGDMVTTSGIDGIYPKGFVVGQIESIRRGVGDYGSIVVRPAVNFSTIETVLVVLTPAAGPAEQPGGPAGEAPGGE